MARLRWLKAEWPTSLRAMIATMKAAEFNERSGDGFIIERTREAMIEGQYIEKRLLEDVSMDPFGNEQRTNYVGYRRVRFRLRKSFPEIQVWNAPRSIQSFVSRLAELNKFALAIGSIDVNVIKWSEALSQGGGSNVEVVAIQAGEITFPDGVIGKVFLRGEEARSVMDQIVKSRKHMIERVVVRMKHGNKAISVQLCKDGAAHIGSTDVEGLVERVRESLILAVAK